MTAPAAVSPAAPVTAGIGPAIRARLAARPVAGFLTIVFAVGYPLMTSLVLSWHGVLPGRRLLDRLPVDPAQLTALLVTWAVLLPAALLVSWARFGAAGVVGLLRRTSCWRFGLGWWLTALLGLPLVTLGVAGLLGAALRPVDPITVAAQQLAALSINLLLITAVEELAWAGVVQTRLQERRRPYLAGLLTAVPFALLHWPVVFFGPVSPGPAVGGLAALLVLSVLIRPLIGLVMAGAGGSILAAALVHAVFNRVNNRDGLAAAVATGQSYQIAIIAAVGLWTAVLLIRCGAPRVS